MYKFTISFPDDSNLAKVVFANLPLVASDLESKLHRIMLRKDDKYWIVEIFTSYLNRNEAEVKTVFDGKKVNILSKLCGVDFLYKEVVTTVFQLGSVVPVVTHELIKPKDYSLQLCDAIMETEFRYDDLPFVSQSTFKTIKPDDTWLSFLQRQSEQTQQSVFLDMLMDMTAHDSVAFSDLQSGARDNFIIEEMVRSEYADFYKHMLNNHKLINKDKVYETIINNGKRVQSLNKILIDALVSTVVTSK